MDIKVITAGEEVVEMDRLMEEVSKSNLKEPWLEIKERTGWDRLASDNPIEILIVNEEVFIKYD